MRRKFAIAFVGFLIALFFLWFGDAIDKSDEINKTGNETLVKTTETVMTADYYISIAKILCGAGAVITGIVTLVKK
jgi:hypothetical protein